MSKLYKNERTIRQKRKLNIRRLKKEEKFMKKWKKQYEDVKIINQCIICGKEIIIFGNDEEICEECNKQLKKSSDYVRNLREEKWNKAMEIANGNFQKACDIYEDIIL